MSNPIIYLQDLRKSYFLGRQELPVLKGINLEIHKNEYVALMGPSGSGKSTLMNILGCLDSPTRGRYVLNEKDVSRMPDDDLATVRNMEIGFVFQQFNLLPRLTAAQNVSLPLVYAGVPNKERHEKALAMLEKVGLADRSHSEYAPGTDLISMIKEDLIAERIAIDTYADIIRWVGDDDPTTRKLMVDILKVEEEHADDMANLLSRVG